MTSPAESRQDLLLSEYVSCFDRFGELSENPAIYPVPGELAVGKPNEHGWVAWRPRRTEPQAAMLDHLHSKLPAKFPPLFERFLLTFRWADVSLDRYSLIANPPGPDLERFYAAISKDPGLWEALIPAGYLRFGKGEGMDYGPVCFDMNSRKKSHEMRVVKIDDEEILCNRRIKVVAQLAPSFEALVLQTIETAKNMRV